MLSLEGDSMIELLFALIVVLIITFATLIYVFWKYSVLRGQVDKRARQIFEEWREKELEKMANERANVLFESWRQKFEQEIRKDAIERSKSVIMGKVTEHLVPYMPDFKYNPKDVRFIGSPIDLIIFDGLDEGNVRKIVFAEIKTGKTASLSEREKKVKKAVESKKVSWELIHIRSD